MSTLRIGVYLLDLGNRQLLAGARPLPLRRKAFTLLSYLAQRPHRLVGKEELLEAVWPRRYVTDAVLKVTMRELRLTLGDDVRQPSYIATRYGYGYEFIAAVQPTVEEIC